VVWISRGSIPKRVENAITSRATAEFLSSAAVGLAALVETPTVTVA
jgi:hypothetical protein